MCANYSLLNKNCNIKYIIGAAGAQLRRIRANSEMHLTVLSRVEDENRFLLQNSVEREPL